MFPFFSFFLNLKHVVAKIYFQTLRGMNESDVFLETLGHGSYNFTAALVLNKQHLHFALHHIRPYTKEHCTPHTQDYVKNQRCKCTPKLESS